MAAQYYALLSQAMPGATWHDMQWHISLVMGWSLIHAGGILQGNAYIWPDPQISTSGRMLLAVRDRMSHIRQHGIASMLDL